MSLHPDRDHAGRLYESIRRKLLEFFEARGSDVPEEHADETFDRVMRRMTEGEKVENPASYCYGVAKFLWMEVLRRQSREPVVFDDEHSASTGYDADDEAEREQRRQAQERRLECFEECLRKLPDETRTFIVEYYREENGLKIEQRKAQAAQLKTTLNALRLRASRLRRELAACINSCLSRPG